MDSDAFRVAPFHPASLFLCIAQVADKPVGAGTFDANDDRGFIDNRSIPHRERTFCRFGSKTSSRVRHVLPCTGKNRPCSVKLRKEYGHDSCFSLHLIIGAEFTCVVDKFDELNQLDQQYLQPVADGS